MSRTPDEILADLVSGGLKLDSHEVNVALRDVWPLMHGPLHRYDQAALLALFKHAGYISDGVAYPTADLTIYRGEPVASGQQGISWTTDRQVALKYARGYSTVGDVHVLRATVPIASVLACFAYEDEVVSEPVLLKSVERVWNMPHFKLSLGAWR